jgi:hypothetical protein
MFFPTIETLVYFYSFSPIKTIDIFICFGLK